MTAPAIVFEGVWKKFRRGARHDSLRDLVPALAKRLFKRAPEELGRTEFWALRDVSFTVGPGDALGIIGSNGAGKSTALKLLTKIMRPTRGRAEVRGRFGALIEVAAGFHPDLTGRENTYLQGAIMGMKARDIARKFDEIVEFAGVADFIDTQVKYYSSGMNARLGFAIAAHLDPDVLIIDEVLAVGDAAFQDRCMERMRALRGRGIPIAFVSHNLQAVQDLCTRAIVLERGTKVYEGKPEEAIQHYRRSTLQPRRPEPGDAAKDIRIAGVELLDGAGGRAEWFRTGGPLTVRVHYDAARPVERPHFAVEIHRADGVYAYGTNSGFEKADFGTLDGRGAVDLVIPRLWLLPGFYTVSVGIMYANLGGTHDVHWHAYSFSVASDRRDHGIAYLEHAWKHEPAQVPAEGTSHG